jgi:exonuclease VII large subunit
MFQETDRRFQETDRRFQETDRRIEEMFAKRDRESKETYQRIEEMFTKRDRESKETYQRIEEMFTKRDRESKETYQRIEEIFANRDRELEKTERLIQKLTEKTDKQLGELGNRFGELAEHLITPNITEKFRALGYAFTKAGPDVKFTDAQGRTLTEVDVWLENGEFALAVEVKSYLRIQDVKDHINRMGILRKYADERRDTRKLLGAAAGAIVKPPVRNYALEQGFYVIEQSGDTVKIEAPQGFTPRIW